MSEPSDPSEVRADQYDGVPAGRLADAWGVPVVEAWSRIGSTNDRARALAAEGAPRGTVVIADEQTAGRGRRGSRWQSTAGAGVWMSVILEKEDARPQLPLIVGVACAEALEEACGAVAGDGPTGPAAVALAIEVKWPNDLLVRGRKLGGVLVESAGSRAVVGVGINASVPAGGFDDEIEDLATALEVEAGKPLSRNVIASRVVGAIIDYLGRDDPARDAIDGLRRRDALLGREVETEAAGVGLAAGVDETGALLLERPDGSRVSVVSGSVWAGRRP